MDAKVAMEHLAAVVRDIDGARARLDRLTTLDGIPRPKGEEAPLLTAARAALATHPPIAATSGVGDMADDLRAILALLDKLDTEAGKRYAGIVLESVWQHFDAVRADANAALHFVEQNEPNR